MWRDRHNNHPISRQILSAVIVFQLLVIGVLVYDYHVKCYTWSELITAWMFYTFILPALLATAFIVIAFIIIYCYSFFENRS